MHDQPTGEGTQPPDALGSAAHRHRPRHVSGHSLPAPRPATLRLSVHDHGRSALVTMSGELDITTCPLLQAVLDDVLRARRIPRLTRLVLDMGAISFADAAGLSPVLHARAVLSRRGGGVELRSPSRPVRRLLRLLDLPDLLTPAVPGRVPLPPAPAVPANSSASVAPAAG